ncbi:MAG TPA: hypothetical protein VGG03_02105 [Thermoanaerobaculia bacterium]
MARFTTRCLILALAAGAAQANAAHAGVVYVPAPGPSSLGGSTYEVQVSVTNTAPDARDVKQVLLAHDTDGTQRTGAPATVQLAGGRSTVVRPGSAFRGLLELSGGGELRYAARLAGTGPGRLGVYLPVITSDNLIPAGQTTTVQGLLSGAGRATDLTLVNVAQQGSQCTASVTRADGTVLIAPVTFNLMPLSQRTFGNIFANGDVSEARAMVSCTREFFVFALLTDAATGEVSYVGPSASGESLLRLPGEGPVCPPTAACFDTKGIVHQPTPATPVRRVVYNPVPGTYSKIHMTMDVYISGFSPQNPAALHMLFWLVRDRNFNMFGYGALRGPDTNQVLLRHGIGLTHANKLKIVQPFTAPIVGKTYHLDYTYDTARGFLELTMSDSTGVVQRLTGVPNVSNFSFKAGERIIIDLGFPGTNPDEARTDGWIYRDLHLELSK